MSPTFRCFPMERALGSEVLLTIEATFYASSHAATSYSTMSSSMWRFSSSALRSPGGPDCTPRGVYCVLQDLGTAPSMIDNGVGESAALEIQLAHDTRD